MLNSIEIFMHAGSHTLSTLFAQLGLDYSEKTIQLFIRKWAPIPNEVPLHQAIIWSSSQSNFLQEAVNEDADWACVVDQLDSMLRKTYLPHAREQSLQ